MPLRTRLPELRPLLSISAMDAMLSTTPAWTTTPNDPPDGSETGATNAERCPVDFLEFGIDHDLEEPDHDRLEALGWKLRKVEWVIRGEKADVIVYSNRSTGAQVYTYPGHTGVRFCPGRVIFGRNDRMADVTSHQLAIAIQAHTAHLMPATTRVGRHMQMRTAAKGRSMRNRAFLVWTLGRIDLCVQARVGRIGAFFALYRHAVSPRSRNELPVLWRNERRVVGRQQGDETGLTWGVPAPRWTDLDAQPEDLVVTTRKRSSRVSITLYDKGAEQRVHHSCVGEPVPIGEFARLEVSFRGIDACAHLLRHGHACEPEELYLLTALFRRPKKASDAGLGPIGHAVWVDLDFAPLHRAIHAEAVDLLRSRLWKVKIRGRETLRAITDDDVAKAGIEDRVHAAMNGKISSHDRIRRATLSLLLRRLPDAHLLTAFWPRRGQRPSYREYAAAMINTKRREVGPADMQAEWDTLMTP